MRKRLPILIFYGVIGYTTFNAVLYTALKYTTAINVAIEQAGIPMLIFLINFVLFRTRVSLAQVFGFSLTLVGVALTASHGDLASLLDLTLNFGDALISTPRSSGEADATVASRTGRDLRRQIRVASRA